MSLHSGRALAGLPVSKICQQPREHQRPSVSVLSAERCTMPSVHAAPASAAGVSTSCWVWSSRSWGPSRLLAAQGAFAVAYSLDPALQDRRPEMTIDASVT